MPNLTINERSPFTDIIVLDYLDLQAIGTGGTRIIGYRPAHGGVNMVGVAKTVAAVGSTSTVFDIGTTIGTPTEFISALDADAMTTPVFNTGTTMLQSAGNTTIAGGTRPVSLGTTQIPIYLKLTDAAVASLTAGQWVIGIQVVDLGKFAIQ